MLEVGHILAGPFGGMLLADLGADVIKIEPIGGDLSRQVGTRAVDGHNVYFASLNRNKRSVYDRPHHRRRGRRSSARLAAGAHALLVNLRPSTIRKLGLDYESLRRFNPKIVCVALTGYGLDGPAAEWPAFDYVIQAGTGVAAMTGEPDGPPALAGYSAVDNSSGIMAALGLVAKVLEGKVARSTSRSSTSCSRSSTTRPRPTSTAATCPGAPQARRAHLLRPGPAVRDALGLSRAVRDPRRVLAPALCEIDRAAWADDPRFATMAARFENRDRAPRAARRAAGGGRGRRSGWRACARSGSPSARWSTWPTRSTATWCAAAAWWCRSRRPRGRSGWSGTRSGGRTRRPEHRVPPRLHEHTGEVLDATTPRGGLEGGPLERANDAVSSPRANVLKVKVNPT